MNIPQRMRRCIGLIEKHGFRLERLEAELYEWLEKNKVNINSIDSELESLIHGHDGNNLIKKLEKK